MNILYIGHYREKSGWGQAGRDYLKALIKSGANVIARPILLNKTILSVDEEIKRAEKNNIKDIDICIQCVLPHYMTYDGNFKKNIGIFFHDTENITSTNWFQYLKQMDEIWVPNKEMRDDLMFEIKNMPRLVHIPTDITKYSKDYSEINVPMSEENYKFYFIGDFTRRKNISGIIKAYYSEFSKHEPVSLVLKLSKFGTTSEKVNEEIQEISRHIGVGLKKYNSVDKYPKISCITQDLPEDTILALHKSCDCFVCPSYGESWCLPAFDAAFIGNQVIASNQGGFKEYLRTSELIRGHKDIVFGAIETFEDLFTSNERWFSADISQLAEKMRFNYESGVKPKRLNLDKFSYEEIGKQMKLILEEEYVTSM
jgi:glycosyltransferase involved in cell wall biosynthesis